MVHYLMFLKYQIINNIWHTEILKNLGYMISKKIRL